MELAISYILQRIGQAGGGKEHRDQVHYPIDIITPTPTCCYIYDYPDQRCYAIYDAISDVIYCVTALVRIMHLIPY